MVTHKALKQFFITLHILTSYLFSFTLYKRKKKQNTTKTKKKTTPFEDKSAF